MESAMRMRIAQIRLKHSPSRDPELERYINARVNEAPLKQFGAPEMLEMAGDFENSYDDAQLMRELAKSSV